MDTTTDLYSQLDTLLLKTINAEKVLVPEDVISLGKYSNTLAELGSKLSDIEYHLLAPSERGAAQILIDALEKRIELLVEHDRIMKSLVQRLVDAESLISRVEKRLNEALSQDEVNKTDTLETKLEKVICAPVPLGYKAAEQNFKQLAAQ